MKVWHKLALSGASAAMIATAVASHFEGTRLRAYADVGGVWTLCTGHTEGVRPRQTATPFQCKTWLARDMAHANAGIKACVHRPITDGQEAALTDFAFNVGVPRACGSTMVTELNAGKPASVWCKQLLRWVYANGQKLPGLVKRRKAEYDLCLSPEPSAR